MLKPEERLRRAVANAVPRLEAVPDAEASVRRDDGGWSVKEIVGHLIDSASNNHQRFVRAQFSDDLVCLGYDQVAWVTTQRYQSADWRGLIALWASFNLHLANVIEALPPAVRSRQRFPHNLHQVAYRTVPASEPTTLEYFMSDYAAHLEHHLVQILGPTADWPT